MAVLRELQAPAKLNLFLHVTARRADGYHCLQSVFILIDWHDTLHIETRGDLQLRRHDLGPPLPEDDLCLRAARALQEVSGARQGADIHIDKRLPHSAGLGGGSSDAATVLLALNELWGLHWPLPRLASLGLTLGADVPFFLQGLPAWVEGIGERITPLQAELALPKPLMEAAYVVVKPPPGIATPVLFAQPDLVRDTKPAIISDFLEAAWAARENLFATPATSWRNDLQPVAMRLCVPVQQACQWLEQRFGNSRMSGSGSAVFALATGEDAVPRALSALHELPEGWEGRVCRALREHPWRLARR